MPPERKFSLRDDATALKKAMLDLQASELGDIPEFNEFTVLTTMQEVWNSAPDKKGLSFPDAGALADRPCQVHLCGPVRIETNSLPPAASIRRSPRCPETG